MKLNFQFLVIARMLLWKLHKIFISYMVITIAWICKILTQKCNIALDDLLQLFLQDFSLFYGSQL